MRIKGRTDANQEEIVKQLRQIGASVWVTSSMGHGAPDLVVGWRGLVCLPMEIKDGDKPTSAQKLTADEVNFHSRWAGPIAVVTSGEHAVTTLVEFAKKLGAV